MKIDFEGGIFATAETIAEETKHLSDVERNVLRQQREHYAEKMKKFAEVEGCQLVYEKVNQNDGYALYPDIYFNGLVMMANCHIIANGQTVTMKPYFHGYTVERGDNKVSRLLETTPAKVAKPTAKKLQDWSEWGKLYIQTCKAVRAEYRQRIETNLARLKAIEGVREIREGKEFEVRRNGFVVTMLMEDTGQVFKNIHVDYSTCWDNFKDCTFK